MKKMQTRHLLAFAASVACLLVMSSCAEEKERNSLSGVIQSEGALLTPEFWIERLEDADLVMMNRIAIDEQNEKLFTLDSSMHDLDAFPETLSADRVAALIEGLADAPAAGLYDEAGDLVAEARLAEIADNRNLAAIPAHQGTRFGLVTRRADLRTFPTRLRVFRSPASSDIDRFQESAVFPGTPVIIAHESGDGVWQFVISPRYAAWIEKQYIAEGTAGQVFGYTDKTPYRIVTGATVHTVFNPEQPALSELQLDMGVRVPVLADRQPDQTINGQHTFGAHVIELPVRTDDGALQLEPALLQVITDTEDDYLPMTRVNIIRQSLKFLGERYGWGHSYNGRDCSGFVSEVYRSMGALIPRNTSAQSKSPALSRQSFGPNHDSEARLQAVLSLDVGDLVYIPGHVMLVIGAIDGDPWVIHDTTGISYRTENGEMARVPLNAVSVTPLLPLQFDETQRYVDAMTSIVKIVPESTKETSQPL
jgi:hypothetical protein